MIDDLLPLLPALLVGAGLGWFFFGGLWLTLQRLPTSRRPMMLALGSLLLRMGLTVLGFYLITGGDWRRLATALVGFLIVRQVMIWRIRPPAPAAATAKGQGEIRGW